MKAQQFFGGTHPKQTGKDSTNRQVGNKSATPGVNAFKNNSTTFNPSHKATVTTTGIPRLQTTPLSRPNIKGKSTGKVGQ